MPLASGKNGRMARSCRSHASSRSVSPRRRSRLSSFCTLTKRRRALLRRRAGGLVEQRAVEIGAPDLAHLAVVHRAIEGLEGLVDRRRLVGRVELEEIDAIGAEATQAAFHRRRDRSCARTGGQVGPIAHAELGRDDDVIASRPERGAEQLLAPSSAVDVGGVEQGDTGIERGVNHGLGRGLIDPATEVVATESDGRDGEACDLAGLHVLDVRSCPRRSSRDLGVDRAPRGSELV